MSERATQQIEGEEVMETTWRVMQVTEKPGLVEATLRRVEWFMTNPAHTAAMADESQQELPEEFLDVPPGTLGADVAEIGGELTLDVTGGPELHPLDDVVMTLRVVVPVDA